MDIGNIRVSFHYFIVSLNTTGQNPVTLPKGHRLLKFTEYRFGS